jgi:protease secretion system membrane fusion protein
MRCKAASSPSPETGNVEVKSPVDGVVVGSTVFTKGGVVGAGAKLMDIVPTDDALAVEGQLPVNLVDRVRGAAGGTGVLGL